MLAALLMVSSYAHAGATDVSSLKTEIAPFLGRTGKVILLNEDDEDQLDESTIPCTLADSGSAIRVADYNPATSWAEISYKDASDLKNTDLSEYTSTDGMSDLLCGYNGGNLVQAISSATIQIGVDGGHAVAIKMSYGCLGWEDVGLHTRTLVCEFD